MKVLTWLRGQVAKATDCKSVIVGSTPTGASKETFADAKVSFFYFCICFRCSIRSGLTYRSALSPFHVMNDRVIDIRFCGAERAGFFWTSCRQDYDVTAVFMHLECMSFY